MVSESERHRKPPPRPTIKRCVVIPASIFVGEDRRLATLRLGLLARYLAIFRVEEVVIFGKDDTLVAEVLRYAETPPYLRRRTIPLHPLLRYAGVVPPLQSPHHPSSRSFCVAPPCPIRESLNPYSTATSSPGVRSRVAFSVERVKNLPRAR